MLRKIIVILQRYPENNLFTLKGLIPIEDMKRLPVRVIALFFLQNKWKFIWFIAQIFVPLRPI